MRKNSVSCHGPQRKRRGLGGQRRRRLCEDGVRSAAVSYMRLCRMSGESHELSSYRLCVDGRTLYRWQEERKAKNRGIRILGRPIKASPAARRAEIFEVLGAVPGIGVPSLQRLFPKAGTRELAELVHRYRSATRKGRRLSIYELRWTNPGSVWSMDYSDPPCLIDGLYNRIFCIRDLSSAKELWALPMLGKDAKTVVDSLTALTAWYGAPLVLKADNDSVFGARSVKDWAEANGVLMLYSPPWTPEYNGAIESGMATLKVGAHLASACHARPGEWTCDDIQEGRMRMNVEGRPRGAAGPTPNELWTGRTSIDEKECEEFHRTYKINYNEVCHEREMDESVHWKHAERARIDREALSRTLTKLGYLTYRRRQISLAIKS